MKLSLIVRAIPFIIILISGCNNPPPRKISNKAPPLTTDATTKQQAEQARLNSCRQALDSLKKINPKQATKLNNDFNALISAASQYNSLRDKVANPTRLGIDSMYQFKSVKLCADIEKLLIDSLVMRGENTLP